MSLSQLPPELLLRVSWHLTTPEFGYLRRTCKQIENLLFAGFAREFFTKRQFMIEEISLQALLDIANHPTLSPWLSEVIISLNGLPDVENPSTKTRSKIVQEMQKHGHQSSELLLATGKACNMMVEAFSKLTNLRTVNLRDYSARGRTRDGDASWRSYGWSYNGVLSQVDYHRSSSFVIPIGNDTFFPLVLHALGRAQAKPDSIEVFLRKRTRHGAGLPPTTFGFSKTGLEPLVENVLQGLKTLMLTIAESCFNGLRGLNSFSDELSVGVPWLTTVYPDDNIYEAPLRLLLQKTPNLETLRLNFDPAQWYGFHFLRWLGKPSSVTLVPFDNLTGLDLGMVNVEEASLLQVITKPSKLRSVNLWKVCISVSATDDSCNDEQSSWATLLIDLVEGLPSTSKITSMLIGFPFEVLSMEGAMPIPTRFSDQPHVPAQFGIFCEVLDKVSYRGSDLKQWLKEIAAVAVRDIGLRDQFERGSDEDEEDEDEDEDEDDEGEDDDDDDDMDEDDMTAPSLTAESFPIF